MPKRKSVKNGATEELVKELDSTEGEDKGAPDGKRATPSNRKQPDRKAARKRAEKEQAAAEEDEKEEAAAEGTTEKGMKWEELEEEDLEPQSGLYLITGTDLKKGTATGVINGKRFTVNIKETAKELSARLGRELGEDELKVWARCPVEDIDSVLGMATLQGGASARSGSQRREGDATLRVRCPERGGGVRAADRHERTPGSRGPRGTGRR